MKRFLIVLLFLFPSVSFPAEYSLQLQQVRVSELARIVYGDILKRSFVLDDDVIQSDNAVTLNWLNLKRGDVSGMVEDLLQHHGFESVEKGKILFVRKRQKQDEDLLVYKPRFRSAKYLADILAKVADAHQLGSRGLSSSPGMSAAIAKQPESVGSASSLIDRSAPDQVAYNCQPAECKRLRNLLAELDTPEAQVIVRAALYEVGTNAGEGSALQIAAQLFKGRAALNLGAALNGSDQLRIVSGGLDAVFSVLDQDSRFKVVSRPMLRVRTGTQAKFSVGQQVPVLGALSRDNNGNQIQSVEYRQSGTIFTVQPDIRLDVVDLIISQELSSFIATTTGVNNSPTLLQRMASSQLSVMPGEVVVFAGLEESREDEVETSFFGFSTSKKSNSGKSEVLLFIEAQRI